MHTPFIFIRITHGTIVATRKYPCNLCKEALRSQHLLAIGTCSSLYLPWTQDWKWPEIKVCTSWLEPHCFLNNFSIVQFMGTKHHSRSLWSTYHMIWYQAAKIKLNFEEQLQTGCFLSEVKSLPGLKSAWTDFSEDVNTCCKVNYRNNEVLILFDLHNTIAKSSNIITYCIYHVMMGSKFRLWQQQP